MPHIYSSVLCGSPTLGSGAGAVMVHGGSLTSGGSLPPLPSVPDEEEGLEPWVPLLPVPITGWKSPRPLEPPVEPSAVPASGLEVTVPPPPEAKAAFSRYTASSIFLSRSARIEVEILSHA